MAENESSSNLITPGQKITKLSGRFEFSIRYNVTDPISPKEGWINLPSGGRKMSRSPSSDNPDLNVYPDALW